MSLETRLEREWDDLAVKIIMGELVSRSGLRRFDAVQKQRWELAKHCRLMKIYRGPKTGYTARGSLAAHP